MPAPTPIEHEEFKYEKVDVRKFDIVHDEEDGLYIYRVFVEDGEEYIEPIEDDKEFEEVSEIFEDRLSEIYDFE